MLFRHMTAVENCVRKVRYDTLEDAFRQVDLLNAKKQNRGVLNAYRCERCGGFHVGNKFVQKEAPRRPRRAPLKFPA